MLSTQANNALQFRVLLITLFAFVSLPSFADQDKSISVFGVGTIKSEPDYISFSVFIEEKGETATKLNGVVKQKVKLIVDMLTRKGVQEKHIRMMPFQLQPWFDGYANERQQKGFVLGQQLQIKLVNFDLYAGILDNVLRIGAARISGGQYGLENSQAINQQALDLALQDAKSQAEFIAEKMQQELGDVISIEVHSGYVPNSSFNESARTLAADQQHLPGLLNIQASLSVIYAIQ